jgi:RimJ/RimL family protein N-acetyltransferase
MKYKCLRKIAYKDGEHILAPLREQDMEPIRTWRNEQIQVLRQRKELTTREQNQYYDYFIRPNFFTEEPKTMLFGYFFKNKLIGYGGLTNIEWEDMRAEVSFLLNTMLTNDETAYAYHFFSFLDILKTIAFKELKLNRLFTETYDIRNFHTTTLEKSGFVFEGRMREHVMINNKPVDSLVHGLLKEDK